jgi:hypothetical protein
MKTYPLTIRCGSRFDRRAVANMLRHNFVLTRPPGAYRQGVKEIVVVKPIPIVQ